MDENGPSSTAGGPAGPSGNGGPGVLLIASPNVLGGKIQPHLPYGQLALQAAAAELPCRVDILPVGEELQGMVFSGSMDLADALLGQQGLDGYEVVGLSTVCNSFHHTLALVRLLKQRRPALRIWLGGPHASVLSGRILDAFGEVEAVFTGEGETSFALAVQSLCSGAGELPPLPGVHSRRHGLPGRQFIRHLDDLPLVLPDGYARFLPGTSLDRVAPMGLPLEAARGCPGRCAFCATQPYWGRLVRRKSPQRIVAEAEALRRTHGIRCFGFIGDNFGSPPGKLREFCHVWREHAGDMQWGCAMRVDRLRDDDVDLLARSNCRGFFVGVESASQDTLDRIDKDVCLERELEVIHLALEKGLDVETSFIVGFSWERPEDVNATFNLHASLLRAGVRRSQVFMLCPLPGAPLSRRHEVCFDSWRSDISRDSIPLNRDEWDLVRRHPDLFAQFGYYETPHLDRLDLVATCEAAAQLNHFR